jgi:hypothetical protein
MAPRISSNDIELLSNHNIVEVVLNKKTNQKLLRSLVSFKKGDVITSFSASAVLEKPNHLTVQIDHNKHIELSPDFLQYTNHSCSPNVFYNTTTMKLIAIEEIKVGDEICFFYPSTEIDMAQPFICGCGSHCCLKEIKGAMHMDNELLKKYALTDFVKNQLSIQ